MAPISTSIIILFLTTSFATSWLFLKACRFNTFAISILCTWTIVQIVLSLNSFYLNWDALPPRILFMALPAVVFIMVLFSLRSGRMFIDMLDLKMLTLLHIIRIPVELVLYAIFLDKLIPESMTFKGNNFDILSGISAPIIYYLVFIRQHMGRKLLLIWNILCLLLLFNIVVIAILSAKSPLQQFAFDQPNIGIAYFPFILLPSLIVPIVLFSHLSSIKQLLKVKGPQTT